MSYKLIDCVIAAVISLCSKLEKLIENCTWYENNKQEKQNEAVGHILFNTVLNAREEVLVKTNERTQKSAFNNIAFINKNFVLNIFFSALF